MTVTDFFRDLAFHVGESEASTDPSDVQKRITFLNNSIAFFYNYSNWPWRKSEQKRPSVVGQSSVNLPDDFLSISTLYVNEDKYRARDPEATSWVEKPFTQAGLPIVISYNVKPPVYTSDDPEAEIRIPQNLYHPLLLYTAGYFQMSQANPFQDADNLISDAISRLNQHSAHITNQPQRLDMTDIRHNTSRDRNYIVEGNEFDGFKVKFITSKGEGLVFFNSK